MPCAAYRPCEAGAIAAGAFDAERLDPPVRVCPPDQGPIAPRIRHERVVAEAGPVGSSNPNVFSPNSFGVARLGLGSARRCRGDGRAFETHAV